MKRGAAFGWSAGIISAIIASILVLPGGEDISRYNYLPLTPPESFITHNFYSLLYNEDHEQADWVAYKIDPGRGYQGVVRTDRFIPDTSVKTGSANNADYYRSGYDRGHMAPAADMSFSELAMSESFLYSNISPQLPGFNRGIWKQVEDFVRKEALLYDSIYVFSGPVYKGDEESIGDNHVTIPSGFYKIALRFSGNRMSVTGWLFPHSSLSGDPSRFIVTVDSIETVTGIDFFPSLPDRIEKRLEKQ